MKIFMTGAGGFVGSWVAEKLVARGERPICLLRNRRKTSWIDGLAIDPCAGSLAEPASYREALREADIVLHIAGVTKAFDRQGYYEGNVAGTARLMQTILEVAPAVKKVIHVSSQAAAGPSPNADGIDEDFPSRPLTDYGLSKLAAEEIVRDYARRLPVTILRPPVVYGPRDTDFFEVYRSVKRGVNLKVGSHDTCASMIHVFDLADGIIEAGLHSAGVGKTYFICDDDYYRWSTIVQKLEAMFGKKVRDVRVPYRVAVAVAGVAEWVGRVQRKPSIISRQKMREVSQPYWIAKNDRIKQDMGYRSRLTLDEGLRLTYDWYRHNSWL